jgi:hypothetical protein
MPRNHGRGQRRTPPAVAVASACADCAAQIGSPQPWEPGRYMAIIHVGHVGELEAIGWVLTADVEDPDGPPDIACQHYHAAYWEDDHSQCCGEPPGGT